MECNKEEAIRAKEIAEMKMQIGDFEAAKRIALKAQRLYPELENISQMLTVCDVHCSAKVKVYGSELDWYGILQVERFSDEAVIKKQYRKLALSLHPDKNKFAGAEAAFKLIGEANRVLTDPAKRPQYDLRCKSTVRPGGTRPAPHHTTNNAQNKKQDGAVNKLSNVSYPQSKPSHPYQQPPQLPTFWTCCTFCGMKFQYYKEHQNKMLSCQNCHQNFVAIDLGVQGVWPGSSWSPFVNQKGVPTANVFPESNGLKSSGTSISDKFVKVDPVSKAGKAANVGGRFKPKESKAGNPVEAGSALKQQEKASGYVHVEAEKKDVPLANTSATKSKETGTSKGANKKRGRKSADEFSEGFDTGSSSDSEENGGNVDVQNYGHRGDGQCRRSSRQKQQISYRENLSDDDDFVNPPSKKSKGIRSCNFTEDMKKEADVGYGVGKEDNSAGSINAMADGNKKEVKQKASPIVEESLLNKRNKKEGMDAERREPDEELENNREFKVNDKLEKSSDEEHVPESYSCPDAEFNDFEKGKAEHCFAVNQVWALYDNIDCMPRFYARIKKVLSPEFKLEITWLEASSDDKDEQDWKNENLPVACGKFKYGDRDIEERKMFSHPISCVRGSRRGTYLIYPSKGETWALFKDWDMKWRTESEKHRPPYQFEFVEVLSNFEENVGIRVAYLGKVEGFLSIFQQAACGNITSFCIPPAHLYRFSHCIPSFRMTGKERKGVPPGSFELDPASLPSNYVCLGDLGDVKMEKEKLDGETLVSCSLSPKNKVNSTNGSQKICTPKKHKTDPEGGTSTLSRSSREYGTCKIDNEVLGGQSMKDEDCNKVPSHENHTSSQGINSACQPDETMKTSKRKSSELAAFLLNPRRSPRDISKRKNEESAVQCTSTEGSKKHATASKNENDAQLFASLSQCDDKMCSDVKDGSLAGLTRSPISSGRRVVEIAKYDFTRERSVDKFQIDQIWSLYSDKDGMPRSYVQVKKIECSPDVRLYVTMLESCAPPKDAVQPVCCGSFKVKSCKLKVFPVSMFSHQLKAEAIGKNRYEIYPRKGEIWAVYKNWGTVSKSSHQDVGERDIVEVLENNGDGVRVVVIRPVKGSENFYWASRIRRSQTAGVMDIPRDEYFRFSHQCLAFLHSEEKSSWARGLWELDLKTIPGAVIVLD